MNEKTNHRGIFWPGEISFDRFIPLFEAKYGLSYAAKDFWVGVEDGTYIFYCPSLPNLTETNLLELVPNRQRVFIPTFQEFFEAYAEKEIGNDQKMKDFLARYERTKRK